MMSTPASGSIRTHNWRYRCVHVPNLLSQDLDLVTVGPKTIGVWAKYPNFDSLAIRDVIRFIENRDRRRRSTGETPETAHYPTAETAEIAETAETAEALKAVASLHAALPLHQGMAGD